MPEDQAKKPVRRINDITPVRPAGKTPAGQPAPAKDASATAEAEAPPAQTTSAIQPAKPKKPRKFLKRFLLFLLILILISAGALLYFGYVVE